MHFTFLHVIFTEQFPLCIDVIIGVRRSSMNFNHLSTDCNSKHLTVTVPLSGTSTVFDYLQVYEVPTL